MMEWVRQAAVLLGLALWLTPLMARAEPLIVATTPDLKSLTEAVSGGVVRVESLVAPGTDAEAFEPRPSHLALVREAALIVRVGLGYDDWVRRLVVQAGNKRAQRGGDADLDLSTQVALLEVQGRSVEQQAGHAHGAANPHYWLDPANAEVMSAAIAEALVRIVPEKREVIEAAQARFALELKEKLERWTRILEPHRGAPIVAYHNSWPYFARRFRLNIVDVIEPKEGVPPSAARLLSLAATIRAKRVRAVVHEAFEPVEASRSLAERTGARLVVLAPSVGSLPGTDTYLSLFDRNVDLLAKALGPEP